MIDVINSRKIFYYPYSFLNDENWPDGNFLLLAIINDKPIIDDYNINELIVSKQPCYVCCAGVFGELLHDLVDETIVFKEIQGEMTVSIITTWHQNLHEALEFSIISAICDAPIQNVIILNDEATISQSDVLYLIEQVKAEHLEI